MPSLLRPISCMIALVCLSFSLASPVRADDYRTWSDSTGKFKLKAKLESVEDGKAILVKENGDKMKIAVEKLSSADRDYIEKQNSDSPFEKAEDSPFESTDKKSTPASNGTRNVKVDWSLSQEIPPASPDAEWKIAVPAGSAS